MSLDNNSVSEYLTFYVNGVLFAINSLYIDSVASLQNVTRIPRSDITIDGITSFRDSTIPVINLGGYLFNKNIEEAEHKQCIVCKIADKNIAFRINSVKNIVIINNSELMPVDSILRNYCDMLEGFMTDKDKNITEILDIKHIIGQYESLCDN